MILHNDIFAPPPDITISQWADEYRELPPEASSEPGHWNTNRAPYQRAMMDAVSDSRVERVVMMTAAQVGKSEILLNTIGYYVDKEPSPILMMQPTLEMGESFSKDRLATMLRDCTCLHGKVKDPRARDSGNTLLHKTFPGGHITIAGANSPASLASRPIRILLCDEVDRYPVSAGTEGDPVSLAMKRTQNFWNRRVVLVSTPTMIETSRIVKEFAKSTRSEWNLPCPKCGGYNVLDWERLIFKDKTQPVLRCCHCGHEGSESEWKNLSLKGKWIDAQSTYIKGFHVNALASPWVSWPDIVAQYLEAYNAGTEMLKVWRNTVLGLPYEAEAGAVPLAEIDARLEPYNAEIPDGVLVLTAGIDTQDNRLEVEVVGHGLNNESWGIYYGRIYGDPSQPGVWRELDSLLLKEWSYADGERITISCACIDSGGHHTDDVYRFCKGKARRNVYAIVGRGGFGTPSVNKPSRNNRMGIWLFTLGVNTLKGEVFSRLQADKGANGYCHFPVGDAGYDSEYFAGLLSEKMVVRRRRGLDYITWEKISSRVRNEPLDCRVYALGAFRILNPDLKKHERAAKTSTTEPKPKVTKATMKKTAMRGILRRGLNM